MSQLEGNCFAANGQLQTVQLEIKAGKISGIRTVTSVDESLPMLLPGFVDIHVHGGGGADTMDASKEAFDKITHTHARFGTTSLLLTTVTESIERIDAVLQSVKPYMQGPAHHDGARVLGVHLEGPFIHPERPGAQRKDRIVDPNPDIAEKWFDSGVVKMMTMAPERPHAHDVARLAHSRNILVSAGHTRATSAQLADAKPSGFRHVTHLCNAMDPLLHRNVGPIGQVIEDEDYTADFICDGVHIHPAMIKALIRSIGSDRLMLITDAIRAAAMDDGTYDLGGQNVYVKDGECRLEDGTLAGSVLTMSNAFRMVQRLGGVSPLVAMQMASLNPARRLGLPNKGKIEVGYDADLVWLDKDGSVLRTMTGGHVVYEK